MNIDFYYWSFQCPLNVEMLQLLAEYQSIFQIHTYDIAEHPEMAKQQHMYFPTLTVVDHIHRFVCPLTKTFLDTLAQGIILKEIPYVPSLSRHTRNKQLQFITQDTYTRAGVCIGKSCVSYCEKKIQFLNKMNIQVYGVMNLDGINLLGGAEYVPSHLVPYDIPKDSKMAFLTCVYTSNEDYDGKSAPLLKLEQYLSQQYERVIVISDECGVFPNGDLKFFKTLGYHDRGIISIEKDYCILHIMEKQLHKEDV